MVGFAGCLDLFGDEEIEDWHDLDSVRENLDGDYVLVADLDDETAGYDEHVCEPERGWEPIGDAETEFTGRFDGQDHEIADLKTNVPVTERRAAGLFGVSMGSLENVLIINADISGGFGGALVTQNEGKIVASSVRDADITGERTVGGLVGINNGGKIVMSSVRDSNITGERAVGGLVGRNAGIDGILRESFASEVTVIGDEAVGGHIGGVRGFSEVAASWATGDVTGENRVGGFAGLIIGSVSESWTASEVSGTDAIGGFVGEQDGSVAGGYWNSETANQATGSGEGDGDATSLTTDKMQGTAAEGNMNTLDFEEIWATRTDPDGYPLLQWQTRADDETDRA